MLRLSILPLPIVFLTSLWPLNAKGTIALEATAWQTRLNEVRRPADGGTTFSFPELLGKKTSYAPRLDASWAINERHGLRVLLAPFEVSGTGNFAAPVNYQGHVFQPGLATDGLYRFNSWRLTYRYTLLENGNWHILAGATLKIRDAKVQLRQAGHTVSDSNIGIVPLAHIYAERRLPKGFSAIFETDALAAPQGRAIDAALLVRWQASQRLYTDLGYRMLEGGADNKKLYTWARLDGWRAGVGFRY